MTIRDGALRALDVLAGQPPQAAPRSGPDVPGRLTRELSAAVADPLVDRSRIEDVLARLTGQARTGQEHSGRVARLAVATVLALEGPQAAGQLLEPWRAARGAGPVAGPIPGACALCTAELQARVLADLGHYVEAVEAVEAVQLPGAGPPAGGCCPECDAGLLGAALLPLLGAGYGSRALAWHSEGRRRTDRDPARLHLLADHVDFLRLTANGPSAVELVRTHAALLRAGATAAARLRWLTSASHAAAEQVQAGHGGDLVAVAWPERPTEPMTLAQFSAALYARACPLAATFDARNGDRRHTLLLTDPHRHDRARVALPVHPRGAGQRGRRAGLRPITLRDVLAGPDPHGMAEEALLSCTLVDPPGVWQELVLRASDTDARDSDARDTDARDTDTRREAAARAVLARVMCLTGDRERCLAEAATAAAMSAVIGDRVAVAAADATAAACWVACDARHGLMLARRTVAELTALPPSIEAAAALCRARSAGVAALLTLDLLDEAERWVAEIHPAHPGQQVRVASQRAMVLRRRDRLPEATVVLREGARIADVHGLVALAVEIRLDLAEVLELAGDTDGVVGTLTRALLDVPHVPEPDSLEVPRIRMDLARVLTEAGRLAPARAELERVRQELRPMPDAALELATADYLLGIVLRELRQPAVALTHFDAAAAAFEHGRRPDGVALAQRDRGAVLFALGRGPEAAEAFDVAVAASEDAGAPWHALVCGIDAAQVRGYAGAPGAFDELRRLRAVSASAGAPGQAELDFQRARVDHALARCAVARGEVASAAELAERALAGYRSAGADRAVAALSVDAGAWWWQAGDTGSALRYLRGAMRSARALGDGGLIVRCAAVLHRLGGRQADLLG
ncbi:MAG TPA: hypothetical protein VGJ13_05545 [Pseudonocardiaceae bacterium]|jgi:tetratricopeptide (TPR) repeat protein